MEVGNEQEQAEIANNLNKAYLEFQECRIEILKTLSISDLVGLLKYCDGKIKEYIQSIHYYKKYIDFKRIINQELDFRVEQLMQ